MSTSRRRVPRTEIMWAGALVALALAVGAAILIEGALEGSKAETSITMRIVSPQNDATVTSPVTLTVETSGVRIAAAEEGVEGAAHYHAFVNVHPFTPAGQKIPTGEEDIIHFATDSVELDLQPGVYTVIVALGDNEEVRLRDAPAVSVDFTVE